MLYYWYKMVILWYILGCSDHSHKPYTKQQMHGYCGICIEAYVTQCDAHYTRDNTSHTYTGSSVSRVSAITDTLIISYCVVAGCVFMTIIRSGIHSSQCALVYIWRKKKKDSSIHTNADDYITCVIFQIQTWQFQSGQEYSCDK